MVLLQDLKKLILSHLVGLTCSLLKLAILLAESVIKSWHLYLIVIHECLLLFQDNLIKFVDKSLFACLHCFFALIEDLTHQLWKILKVFVAFLGSLFHFILQVSKVTFEVIQLKNALIDKVLFRPIHVVDSERSESKHLSNHHLLVLSVFFALFFTIFSLQFFCFLLHGFEVLRYTLLAERLVTHVNDRLWEVSLADVGVQQCLLLLKDRVLFIFHFFCSEAFLAFKVKWDGSWHLICCVHSGHFHHLTKQIWLLLDLGSSRCECSILGLISSSVGSLSSTASTKSTVASSSSSERSNKVLEST
jgi:hypothetical protein